MVPVRCQLLAVTSEVIGYMFVVLGSGYTNSPPDSVVVVSPKATWVVTGAAASPGMYVKSVMRPPAAGARQGTPSPPGTPPPPPPVPGGPEPPVPEVVPPVPAPVPPVPVGLTA